MTTFLCGSFLFPRQQQPQKTVAPASPALLHLQGSGAHVGPILQEVVPPPVLLCGEPREGSSSQSSKYLTGNLATGVPSIHGRLWERKPYPSPQRGRVRVGPVSLQENVSFSLPPQPFPAGEGWGGAQVKVGRLRKVESGSFRRPRGAQPTLRCSLNSELEVQWGQDSADGGVVARIKQVNVWAFLAPVPSTQHTPQKCVRYGITYCPGCICRLPGTILPRTATNLFC